MAEQFKAPRGTFDVLPDQFPVRRRIAAAAQRALEAAGYGEIEIPVFEDTDLFARGVGESTDIVQKEMFTFEDQGGRSLTLRPEATASICRAYLEHGMQQLAQPVKLWTEGPFFRHERPQAGRYRQFTQIDAEVIGSDSPLVDAELILLCDEFLRALEVPELTLRIGSLGSPEARASYRDVLIAFLREHESELASDPARPSARPRVRFGELGDLPEGGRPPLPDPDRRDVRDVERDEQRAGGAADASVPRNGRGHDTEREREQRVAPYLGPERQRRDERADRQRNQTHRDVRSNDVAERDCRHLAQRRGDRGRELLGLRPGEQERERECADAEPAGCCLEMLGEDLGAHDDERDPTGERREGEDRCHRR